MNPLAIIQTCVLLSLLALAYWLGGQGARTDLAEYRTKVMASTAKAAQLATKASELARKAEHGKAIELAAIALQHLEDMTNAKRDSERVAADLRNGNLKLRKLWQAGEATDRLSDAATAARHADEITRLRQEVIGEVHGIGAEADAQVRGLQKVVEADRK